ncbi:hypothetical protein [Burkholderia cenocepacia]|uniref:hypothetical protein n=1 Tax=Burkholderia cenocepacia TaxID=95486 RepID=UPI003F49C6D6
MLTAIVPFAEAPCCRLSVLLPPEPPSTMPVCATLSVFAPTVMLNAPPVPPAVLTCEPVIALNVFVLFAPIDTLPLITPELVNVLPPPGALFEPNDTRPLIVPLFVMLTVPPP